jgi:hypothetical protein
LRVDGSGQKKVIQTTRDEALQILKNEKNVLVACRFQMMDAFRDHGTLLKYFRRLSSLPPAFTARLIWLEWGAHIPSIDVSSAPQNNVFETKLESSNLLEKLLNRLKCARICTSQGKIVKETEDLMVNCAFGFRQRISQSPPDSLSLVHILAYDVSD